MTIDEDQHGNLSCHDCGAKEGEIHELGCDMERCPMCGGQLISCLCESYSVDTKRVPFIIYPLICAKCGELWPEFFRVPDVEWQHYIQMDKQRDIICRDCYDEIKALIEVNNETHSLR